MENYFTYKKNLSDNLVLDAVLGYSYQRFQRETEILQGAGFRTTDLDVILNNLASITEIKRRGPTAELWVILLSG